MLIIPMNRWTIFWPMVRNVRALGCRVRFATLQTRLTRLSDAATSLASGSMTKNENKSPAAGNCGALISGFNAWGAGSPTRH